MSTSQIDRVLSVVATLGLVVAVVLLIEQRFRRDKPTETGRVELIKDWEQRAARAASPVDTTQGLVKVYVFTDFECPFCARMDSALSAVQVKNRGVISRFVVHYPLSSHRFARHAATAFECAAAQDRASAMHSVLYRRQNQFGLVGWAGLALQAGVRDTAAFSRCFGDSRTDARIDAGIAFARELAVAQTPVVVVGGWLLNPATPEGVERAIDAALAGTTPQS
jgi:protein-disulfide isomerase